MSCRFLSHLSRDEGGRYTCECEDAFCPMYSDVDTAEPQILCEDISTWQCFDADDSYPDEAYDKMEY